MAAQADKYTGLPPKKSPKYDAKWCMCACVGEEGLSGEGARERVLLIFHNRGGGRGAAHVSWNQGSRGLDLLLAPTSFLSSLVLTLLGKVQQRA